MRSLRIVAISTDIADTVRTTLKAPDYNHPAHAEIATGYGPCRHCLKTFRENEERRILFTYDAFRDHETLPLPGPIFVHERACERYAESGPFPSQLLRIPMTLNAYARGRRLLAQEHVSADRTERVLVALLARADVAYVHVRNREAGCYMFRVERASECVASA